MQKNLVSSTSSITNQTQSTDKPARNVAIIEHVPQRFGKTAMLMQFVERMLDKGETVCVVSQQGVEVRGAGTARDITPRTKLISHEIDSE